MSKNQEEAQKETNLSQSIGMTKVHHVEASIGPDPDGAVVSSIVSHFEEVESSEYWVR